MINALMKPMVKDYHWPLWVMLAWVGLNLADSLLTAYILGQGGEEIGLTAQLGFNMTWVVIIKWVSVTIFPLCFYFLGVIRWFKWMLVFPLFAVVWNVVQL